MTTATIKLYDILIEKGVDKTVAREALEEIVTQDEAIHFATKQDVSEIKLLIERSDKTTIKWAVGSGFAIVAAITGILFGVLQIVL